MTKTFTPFLFLILLFASLQNLQAQTTITQWNFNSNPADGNTGTGVSVPAIGSGTLTNIGGVTSSFSSGSANGGSSDPAPAADNSGYQTTSYAAQGMGDKTTGIQFAVSTVGFTNLIISYDLRHSNTSSRYELLQYTTDITAGTPVWVDAQVFDGNAGDTWFNNRSVNLSAVTALNNNANAGFRVVATFAPSTTAYSGSSSGYGGGTWRFDMLTVKASAATGNVTFVGTKTNVNEATTSVNITANLQGGGGAASSVDIELLPGSTATSGSDFTLPGSLQLNWPAFANNVNSSITVTINNDLLPENTEYFIVRFINPVNLTLPAVATNNFTVTITDNDKAAPAASQSIQLNHIASFSNGAAATNSAEIVAHDPASQRLFIANSIGAKIDIVNFSNPSAATLISSIPVAAYGNINSIAVRNGIVAAAIENTIPENAGKVVFFDINGIFISQVNVGAMPDMIVFSPDGTKVLTANEGQPKADYTVDPEGSVSIVDISGGVAGVIQANVTTAGFSSFNAQAATLKAAGVRIFGPGATVAQDMEPEYIAFSGDGLTAYVTCQENNAIAVINIATSTVTAIRPLGTKDHSLPRNGLDISDVGSVVEIANWPVKGVYMPDAIASYTIAGQTYLITANEGDAREYSPFTEVLRASAPAYVLDPTIFPNAAALKANIGRLNVTTASGDIDSDGDFDEIHAFGGRSISIWNATTGALVWDSGDDMELITSKHPVFGVLFNASNANNTFKNRSDDKGPEPEGVTTAVIAGRTFVFIALERIGGCMVYDVTDPANPIFSDYKNTRTVGAFGGDNGAEGIIYISAANSPTGVSIVILANEISSTLSFYSVNASVLLDITLVGISATSSGNRNRIEWTTAGEEAGDVFEIERSKNGTAFSTLATVQAKGLPSAYTYWDEKPYSGLSFYRLKLKHTSGSISYSKIVTAYQGADVTLKLYPNPVKDKFTVITNATQGMNNTIEIVDISGVVVKTQRVRAQQTTVDMNAMPAGVYTVRYFDATGAQSVKITKQ